MKKAQVLMLVAACLLLVSCKNKESEAPAPKAPSAKVTFFGERQIPDKEQIITLPEFPDTEFVWSEDVILARTHGETKPLLGGMPIHSAYFTDLNADSFPELCICVSFGSGIGDQHIEIYDYHKETKYTLWDRTVFDYWLVLENEALLVKKVPYPSQGIEADDQAAQFGTLALEGDQAVFVP